MALRAGVLRRYLSTSLFSFQSAAPGAVAFSTANAPATADFNSKPAPSETVFVHGLNYKTTSEKLHEAFSKFGQVELARVVTDHNSGLSRGFGFVTYATLEDSTKGIQEMDGQYLDGWVIFAEYAQPRVFPEQPVPSEAHPYKL
ncbi:organelle RRM domain-containing protein 2, mitochondrial-like isoform X1 [Tripterygium wilfordii]|uniref:organelle RRM domain-containing protein 2, mitochondrial-like isoform X1 n=1 Tax=Tripterygium wilfordii TaxID=458696 RepID=UPI0018F805EB|nr:organelle RRM domain-containing protein 2, mitochondrial-like isoform X1 [Tripterygium wilfordii]XP_038685328.1 organelle RRM domain-containing protein 2, mitochondrial-like isoform X1 [Tripterygium wilfordii]